MRPKMSDSMWPTQNDGQNGRYVKNKLPQYRLNYRIDRRIPRVEMTGIIYKMSLLRLILISLL